MKLIGADLPRMDALARCTPLATLEMGHCSNINHTDTLQAQLIPGCGHAVIEKMGREI
jgi:hypothetical protein